MSSTSTAAKPEDAGLAQLAITHIPLDLLMLSTLNVRQTERAADVDSLAEDIAARGLKQNLVVVPAHFVSGEASEAQRLSSKPAPGGTGPWQGRFEVIAGGRRFQAMQLLVQQDRLSATFPVPCMVELRDAAAETSLSENLHRVAMNPADEFEAFRVIVEQAKRNSAEADPVAYCARRFGVTVKHVQGRLRLASLAPEILEALRANQIGLDSAKAYAGVEDHALQLKVFAAQKKSNWRPHDPATVRSALRGETLGLDDPFVKFVGVDAYVEAGGRLETEMFMGTEGEQRIADITLVKKLAHEKAEPMVAPAAKQDGFKAGMLAKGVGHGSRWPSPPEGMEVHPYYAEDPTKAQKKKCVGVYAIASTGLMLDNIGMFRPIKPKEPVQERDWEAERAAQRREYAIELRAARLAAYTLGSFKGTPLEGNAFWPYRNVPALDTNTGEEGFAMVAVLIRVPIATIEEQRPEAERLIDEEAAAAEAAKATEPRVEEQDS